MFFVAGLILTLGLLVELILAWVLLDWRSLLRSREAILRAKEYNCYVCNTSASVLSFNHLSATSFCPQHKARWHLMNDLERAIFNEKP